MAKLTSLVIILLGFLILEVSTMDTIDSIEYDNSTYLDSGEETRRLLGNILAGKCRAALNRPSGVLPTATITLTRLSNNRLYYFSPVAPATMHVTFDQARTFCQNHGMHLVTVNNAAENTLLHARFRTLLATSGLTVEPWIGLRDTTGSLTYKWVQPGVGTTQTFFGGLVLTPSGCASYSLVPITPSTLPPPPETSWTTGPCAGPRPFICEMEPPCSLVL